jgi:hypothetical protein
MLNNIDMVENLRGLARVKARAYETKTIHPILVEEALSEGWIISKRNKKTISLKRIKSHSKRFEDRVWSMLYKMNFSHLSGEGGASILLNPREKESPINQIDVLGLDNEIAIAIECKSSETINKRPQFQGELAKHASIRERFSYAVKEQYPKEPKRTIILAMFLSNILLSSNDYLRAKEAQAVIFDEEDLSYYESLISHIGPAAKYQFFADILPGKEIPGLSITVPAVKTKMGGANCYTFSISPEYLLKISYVSHRAKGKAFDIDTYQRMLKKSRLKIYANI